MDEKYLARTSLRVHRTLLQKFQYVANFHGRSVNKEVEQLMKAAVEAFQKEHGKIDLSQQPDEYE